MSVSFGVYEPFNLHNLKAIMAIDNNKDGAFNIGSKLVESLGFISAFYALSFVWLYFEEAYLVNAHFAFLF
jgi:hypothetical protein